MKPLSVESTKVYANGLTACPQSTPPDPTQVEICRLFLRENCTRRKTINSRFGSYQFKHWAEDWADEYVTNGAFIVAALAEGYRARAADERSPNAYFNIAITPSDRSAAGAKLVAALLKKIAACAPAQVEG